MINQIKSFPKQLRRQSLEDVSECKTDKEMENMDSRKLKIYAVFINKSKLINQEFQKRQKENNGLNK